jgi:hypothetical protein
MVLPRAQLGSKWNPLCSWFIFDPEGLRENFLTCTGGPEITQAVGHVGRSPGPFHKVPVAVLRMKIGVGLRPGRAGGWSRPMRREGNERKEIIKVHLNDVSKNLIGQK